jgi:hypothetical protein
MEIKKMGFSDTDALNDELLSFIRSVKNREKPEVTGKMGRDALKIALITMDHIKRSTQSLEHLHLKDP